MLLFSMLVLSWRIQSEALGDTAAQFNVFLPAAASKGKVPVLIYLAGLTCTEDNGHVNLLEP
jgi:S-formylglutathione hydrolase